MSLANLVKTGQLKEHQPDQQEIVRLIAAAERGIADALVSQVSLETRFDAAYRAITQIGIAALMAQGYRPDTKQPGHHVTIIQTLTLTLGIEAQRVRVFDTLRRKRNLLDYTGDDIDDASVQVCVAEAEKLLNAARTTLTRV